ncbi:MAG: c-type cytochrome [Chloroflexi bacterium]|nr:c-type cytochrome [Chloroflexota bacterium]
MTKRNFLGLTLTLLLLLLIVPVVLAHAVPESSSPAPNAVLEEPPPKVTIQFNEPVVPNLSRIDLLTQAGEVVETGPLTAVDPDNRTLAIDLPPLEEGAYLVSWQVLSAVDGHTTSGTFSFGVGVEALTVARDAALSAQISTLSAAARWLTVTAVSLLMGLFVFRLLVWNPILRGEELDSEEEALDLKVARLGLRIGMIAIAFIAIALILIFIDQNQAYDLLAGNNLGIWFNSRFGAMWILRFILAALMLFLLLIFVDVDDGRAALRGWVWWVGALLTFVLALSVSLVSHSAALAENSNQAVLVDFAHLLAATMWVGGLLFLALTLWLARSFDPENRTWLYLTLILNFSGLAAIAVGILLVSGVFLAWAHVGTWTKLVGTAYGLALLAKLGVALLTFLIAGLNLWLIKPRLNRAYEQPDDPKSAAAVRHFRILVTVELLVVLVILFITGILTDSQRGQDAPLLSDEPGQTIVTQQADDLTVEVTLTPALVGPNSFDILISDENGKPAADVDEVSVRFTFLGQSLGSSFADAEPVAEGVFRVEGSYISLIGTWQMEVSIRRPGAFDTFVAYRLEAGVGGNIRPVASGVRPLEQAAKFMTLTGSGGTGVLLLLFAILWGVIAAKAAKSEWQLIPLLLVSLAAFWLGTLQLVTFFNEDYTPTKFKTNPILPDVESVAVGQSIFNENCVPCHGTVGRGDGPIANTLNPPPADFASGHTDTHPDGDLYYWILNGIEDTQMPAFKEQFSVEEVWHLVNYVRRLAVQG